jgi:hypothetical protein
MTVMSWREPSRAESGSYIGEANLGEKAARAPDGAFDVGPQRI